MKYSFILSLYLGFVLLIGSAESVHACSGGGYPANLNNMLDDSELIVSGHFVELDPHRLNGIFKVDSYLVGQGPEHLMLNLNNNLALISRRIMYTGSSGDCGGSYIPPVSESTTYLFFLNAREDGSYEPIFRPASTFSDVLRPYYEFQEDDSTQSVMLSYGDRQNDIPPDTREWTHRETVQYILNTLDTTPALPDTSRPYPRTAPVLLTIENRAMSNDDISYAMIPVDSSEPVRISTEERMNRMRDVHQCSEPPCTVYSYFGTDRIKLFPPGVDTSTEPAVIYRDYAINGKRIIASPTSDTFAVWQEDRLIIYSILYPSRGFYATPFGLTEEASIPVSPVSLDYSAAWSPDGRYLAFSDETGLRMWDVFTPNSQPQHIIYSNGAVTPQARYFSPGGRYLAVSEGALRYTYDIVSGTRFADGRVAPDDRSLMIFDTADSSQQHLALQRFVPFSESARTVRSGRNFRWVSRNHYLTVRCQQGYGTETGYFDEQLCYIHRQSTEFTGVLSQSLYTITGDFTINDYDYRIPGEQLAILINDDRIVINDKEIDLSDWLTGSDYISDIQWMPAFFFYEDLPR